jgi:hypothetical protein
MAFPGSRIAQRRIALVGLMVCALVMLFPGLSCSLYNSSISGVTVTMNGNGASDNLTITQTGGLLKHNRKTAGDPNYNSDFDFVTSLAGDQIVTTLTAVVFNINGGGGTDSLSINDTANNIDTNYTITSTAVTGRYTLNYAGIRTVILRTGGGSEQDKIVSTAAGVSFLLQALGNGNKFVTVGNAAHKLDDIQGDIDLAVQPSGSINLDDASQTTGFTYTIDENSADTEFDRSGIAPILCQMASVSVRGGSGNDTFLVRNTQLPLVVLGNGGNNTCIISNLAHRVILSDSVRFDGGNATNSLIVDNSGSTLPDNFSYDSLVLTYNQSMVISMSLVDTVSVLAGSSHNNAHMRMSNATFTPAFLWKHGQNGNNNILQIDAAGNTTETLNVNGATKNVSGTFDIGNNFSPVSWDHVDLLAFNALGGVDLVTATPSADTDILLTADDPFLPPGDTLTLNSVGVPFTLTADTFLPEGFHPILFSGFETVSAPPLPHGPDFIGFFGVPLVSCKTSSRGTACSIKGSLLELNAGDRTDAGSVTRFFLSDDGVLDGADTALNTVSVKALRPGGFKALKVNAKLPAGIDPSGKFLIAQMDAGSAAAELHENNNIVVLGPLVH